MTIYARPQHARRIPASTVFALALGVVLALCVLLQLLPSGVAKSTGALGATGASTTVLDSSASGLLPLFITMATLVIVLVASVLISHARTPDRS